MVRLRLLFCGGLRGLVAELGCGFGLIVGCDLIWVCLIDVKLRVLGLVML